MHVLRAEKGYPIVGQDTDGTVTPHDLGMDWIVSTTKPDFLGKRSFTRADTARPDRKQLVGLLPDRADRRGRAARRRAGEHGDARPRHVELRQRRARPAVRARARRERPRADRRDGLRRRRSPPRSSTPCSTTRREHAVTAVLREVELDAQVSVRGEPPMEPNTVGRRRALARAGRVARARRPRGGLRRPAGGRRRLREPRLPRALRARVRPTCSRAAARSTCTRRSSRPAAARRRWSRGRR